MVRVGWGWSMIMNRALCDAEAPAGCLCTFAYLVCTHGLIYVKRFEWILNLMIPGNINGHGRERGTRHEIWAPVDPLTSSLSLQASAQCAGITIHDLQNLPLYYELMSTTLKSTPLVAPGHTRPVTHLSFSPTQDDGTYLLVSSCKDGNPMLREWTGDWIGTFLGHKGAVWSTKLSPDASRAVSGSADFTA